MVGCVIYPKYLTCFIYVYFYFSDDTNIVWNFYIFNLQFSQTFVTLTKNYQMHLNQTQLAEP